MGLLQALAEGPAKDFWIVVGGLMLVGGCLFAGGIVHLRRGRLYEDTPTSRFRSAAQGYVELEGVTSLMPGDPVIAPLTGGRCCWYRTKVEYRDGEDGWSTISRELSGALFQLGNDEGHCVVNPDGARVIPTRRDVWYGPLARPPWGPRVGRGWLRMMTSKYRYTEERIDIGFPLYAVGMYKTHRGAEASEDPRAQVRELLLKWKRDPRMMALFDIDGNGRVDGDEWEAARKLARERIQEKTMQEMPGADVPVLGKPGDRRPYVLSALPQSILAERARRAAFFCFAFFVVSATLAALLLSYRHVL